MADIKHKTRIIIVTPYKEFLEETVDAVTLPCRDGEVGVMAGHMPLVLALFPGILTVREGNDKKYCVISEGYAEIGQHMVLVVTNSAEWAEQIDIPRAYKSFVKNTELLRETPSNDYKRVTYTEYINRAKARLHLIELYGTDKQRDKLEALRSSGS